MSETSNNSEKKILENDIQLSQNDFDLDEDVLVKKNVHGYRYTKVRRKTNILLSCFEFFVMYCLMFSI